MSLHKKLRFFETAFLGFLALLPIGVAGFVLVKLFLLLQQLLSPLGDALGIEHFLGGLFVLVFLIFAVFFSLYLFGLIFRTTLGEKIGAFFDVMAKNVLPGYETVATALNNRIQDSLAYQAAFISLGPQNTRSIGFVMEDKGGEYLTVFIPSVPVITVGTLHIVKGSVYKSYAWICDRGGAASAG